MVAIAKHLVPSYRVSLLQREHFNATRDPLTGLLNQIAFEERIDQEIKLGARYNKTFALLTLTINHINDFERNYGAGITRNLLIEFAKRLKSCVRSTDTLARLENSCFVVLLPDISTVRSIVKVVQNINQHLLGPFVINGQVIEISPSIGVSVYPDDGAEQVPLMEKSERAMQQVLANNSRHYQFFSSTIAEFAEHQIAIEDKLQYAIEQHAYNIEYDSLHQLREQDKQLLELKVNWHDELLTTLSTNEIDQHTEAVEYSAFFCDLLLAEVCRFLQSKKCKSEAENGGDSNFTTTVLVRLSIDQFFDSQLLRRYRQIINKEGGIAENIALIINETAILKDLHRSVEIIRELKHIGFQIVVDNFCAGLSYIGRFNRKLIDAIRVDGELIRNLDDSMEELSVIEGIIRIANNLQIKTIIPGINNTYQYQTLINMNSDYWQGNWNTESKPPPGKRFPYILK